MADFDFNESLVAGNPYAVTDPRKIPVGRYTTEEFHKLECENLWPHVWQMACRLEQIPQVGDWVEYSNVGKSVLVARCRLSEGNCIAMFAGGGLNEATRLVKAADSPYLVEAEDDSLGDVTGLECRWCAVPSRRDGMMSLIVHVPQERLEDYRALLDEIKAIAPESNPITPDNLPDRWPPEFLMHEARMKKSGWLAQRLHYLGVALLTGLLTIVVRKTRDQPQSAAARYIASLCRNNDYLKLDDYLRMVIDVTHLQRQQIEALLDRYADHRGVAWGSHFSGTALFTCMVKSQEIHLHFVDGNDGGYTAAARDMEARKAQRRKIAPKSL